MGEAHRGYLALVITELSAPNRYTVNVKIDGSRSSFACGERAKLFARRSVSEPVLPATDIQQQ